MGIRGGCRGALTTDATAVGRRDFNMRASLPIAMLLEASRGHTCEWKVMRSKVSAGLRAGRRMM
jgi:hypothetical protein